MQNETDKLIKDLRLVAQDAEDLIRATAGEVNEKTKQARARLVQTLEKAKETAQELQVKVGEKAKVADEVIREHPYESMGVAFGLGLLLGVIVNRGRD
ncbi:MAG TPA: DUF883 family protein [Verrucomicrobiae bacterium]|nr:DUF883 family protein [Verrucomicrobiae bacterium]